MKTPQAAPSAVSAIPAVNGSEKASIELEQAKVSLEKAKLDAEKSRLDVAAARWSGSRQAFFYPVRIWDLAAPLAIITAGLAAWYSGLLNSVAEKNKAEQALVQAKVESLSGEKQRLQDGITRLEREKADLQSEKKEIEEVLRPQRKQIEAVRGLAALKDRGIYAVVYQNLGEDSAEGLIRIRKDQTDHKHVSQAVESMCEIPNLHGIEFIRMSVTSETIAGLRPQLKSLRAAGCDFDVDFAQNPGLSKLQVLCLISCRGQITISQPVTSVKVVHVGGGAFKQNIISDLVNGFPEIEILDLDYIGAKDKDLQSIAKLKKLRWLALNSTQITFDGLQALRGCESLNRVTLNDAPKDGVIPGTQIELSKSEFPDIRGNSLIRWDASEYGYRNPYYGF